MHDRRILSRLAPAFALALPLALQSCSSGGGDDAPVLTVLAEAEPNDDATQSAAITLGRPAGGDVATPADQDWWSVALTAGEILQVEVFAARLDHASWDAASNAAQVKIFDTDGTTELLGHYPAGSVAELPGVGLGGPPPAAEWFWGEQDFDIPMFRAPATGTYYIRVNGADATEDGGEYAIVARKITLPNMQIEDEPVGVSGDNDDETMAEPIAVGTMYGFHVDDEHDYYSFTITAPTFVNFELVAHRNGVWEADTTYYDPDMTLYDTDGVTQLASNDDTYFYDSSIQYWIATPGTYYVDVSECCDDGDAPYFLRYSKSAIGTTSPEAEANDDVMTAQAIDLGDIVDGDLISTDDDYYAFDALAGDTLFIQLFDSNNRSDSAAGVSIDLIKPDGMTSVSFAMDDKNIATTLITEDGTYYVYCSSASGTSFDYSIQATLYRRSSFEAEPNDDSSGAGTFNANGYAAGLIETNGDEDWFSFTASADRLITISSTGDSDDYAYSDGFWNFSWWGSQLPPKLEIYDTDGTTVLATSYSSSNTYLSTEGIVDAIPLVAVSFIPSATGTYYVRVTSDNSTFGDDNFYALRKR